MDLSHSRPHRTFYVAPEKPFNKFLSAVELVIANAIDKNSENVGFEPAIGMGDAREMPLKDDSVDLVLTSPPCLNAIDYVRCSKFSLVWMGYHIADLRRVRTESVGTEAADESPDDDKEVRTIIDALKLRPKLGVLSKTGQAVYVVGENTLRGTYIRTSVTVTKLAGMAGLSMKERRKRTLPANSRYMPPPSSAKGMMHAGMRREVVLSFARA